MGLKTTTLITSITEVPREWVFEFYLNIGALTGQDVKIKSVFNHKDKEPSMFIYFHKYGHYRYNDFSTGKKGDCIDLVLQIFNLKSRGAATYKIVSEYNQYLNSNPGAHVERVYDIQERYKVVDHTVRSWTKNDHQYWAKYKIGSTELDFFIVKPLANYSLRKNEGGSTRNIIIDALRIYGFFKRDGSLYKIYQPHRKKNKFVKIDSYIQGSEQLTYKVPFLVICSSIKDMICLKLLGFNNIETIAPDSENVLIDKVDMDIYKDEYDRVCTILDNDDAGIKAMNKYKKEYGIYGINITIEKDIADMVKNHGIETTRTFLQPLLSKTLRK